MTEKDRHPDAEVVEKVLAGDVESFGVLVERYQKRIFNLVSRMIGRPSEAEDVTQEVFLKLYQNLNKYDASQPLANWLMRIAGNHTLNWLAVRKLTFAHDRQTETDEAEPLASRSEGTRSPAEHAEARETTEQITAALQRLPDDHRLVFMMKYFEGYTAQEIAEITGNPRNTIKTWLFRSRRILCAELKHLAPAALTRRGREKS